MNYHIINQTFEARPVMAAPDSWGFIINLDDGDYTCRAKVAGDGFVLFTIKYDPTDHEYSLAEWRNDAIECAKRVLIDSVVVETGYSILDGYQATIVTHSC